MKNQNVLDVLNNLEVFEENGGEDPYMLVENNEENSKALEEVGVSQETINKYGDEEDFCILALAFSEGYANWYEKGKLVYKDEEIANELKNEIQHILDSPITDFTELHEAIQDRLNQY